MPRRPFVPCSGGCGELLWPNYRTGRPPLCRACRAARRQDGRRERQRDDRLPETRTCAVCPTTFRPYRTNPEQRTCSLSCGQRLRCAEGRGRRTHATDADARAAQLERWQSKNRRRRARKRNAASERYTLAEIAERDCYRCGLCGGPVPMDLRHPDRLSPTIDHIVPISLGGDDTPQNAQLAHLGCNSRKGNRSVGEQLALVG